VRLEARGAPTLWSVIVYSEFIRRVLFCRVRIEIVLDLRANGGMSFQAPWRIVVDGRPTDPPLTTITEVVECLMRLGTEPAEAQRHAALVTRENPRHQFELPERG